MTQSMSPETRGAAYACDIAYCTSPTNRLLSIICMIGCCSATNAANCVCSWNRLIATTTGWKSFCCAVSVLPSSTKQIQGQGRPVLVGTVSVGDSELLSRKLTAAGIAHRVLNARQDKAEAEIVAAAGHPRQVTVATNMAGRGTDIPLAAGVAEAGGLHVIAACRNNAKRIDRQLSGRCARQGDPGSHQTIVSLEDNLIRQNGYLTLLQILSNRRKGRSRFRRKPALYLIRRAQLGIEYRHREARRALRQFDRQNGRLLAFSGPAE
ncbi:MAG: hypothetical protein GY850_23635 [bacterium]|nr:hypothetical protein [bacterium]